MLNSIRWSWQAFAARAHLDFDGMCESMLSSCAFLIDTLTMGFPLSKFTYSLEPYFIIYHLGVMHSISEYKSSSLMRYRGEIV